MTNTVPTETRIHMAHLYYEQFTSDQRNQNSYNLNLYDAGNCTKVGKQTLDREHRELIPSLS